MNYHIKDGDPPFPCYLELHGRCRVCERIDPSSPYYSEEMRASYHPEEFPPGHWKVPLPDTPQATATLMSATVARLEGCPFWIRVGCGCGENRCAAGAGLRGVVFPPDCARCTVGIPT